jgi:GT2 family glycosyltransferase
MQQRRIEEPSRTASAETEEPEVFLVSVVIVSWRRPDHVRACLEHLAQLRPLPHEIVVVDASPDDLTAKVVQDFPGVLRVPFPGGAGHMTKARNVGLLHVTGDVVAFVDDDANVRPGWLGGLSRAFADPNVGAVAGRTCNGLPGEEFEGVQAIGRILPSGELTGNFAADPGVVTDIEHGIGANMSFRREALARLGGFRDDFLGTELREDADIFFRLRIFGYRAVFAPDAVVDHLGAAHVKGKRFDYRYTFWARHNHALLLARNFGLGSAQFRTWLVHELRRAPDGPYANPVRMAVRITNGLAGIVAGIAVSLVKARWGPKDPVRRDRTGLEIQRDLLRS